MVVSTGVIGYQKAQMENKPNRLINPREIVNCMEPTFMPQNQYTRPLATLSYSAPYPEYPSQNARKFEVVGHQIQQQRNKTARHENDLTSDLLKQMRQNGFHHFFKCKVRLCSIISLFPGKFTFPTPPIVTQQIRNKHSSYVNDLQRRNIRVGEVPFEWLS